MCRGLGSEPPGDFSARVVPHWKTWVRADRKEDFPWLVEPWGAIFTSDETDEATEVTECLVATTEIYLNGTRKRSFESSGKSGKSTAERRCDVANEQIDRAIALMKHQHFSEALIQLPQELVLNQDPTAWGAWYMAGQCCRFTKDIKGAIYHLSLAADIKKDESSVFLALGVAYQLNEQWDQAIESFRKALGIDPDDPLIYNSLALARRNGARSKRRYTTTTRVRKRLRVS